MFHRLVYDVDYNMESNNMCNENHRAGYLVVSYVHCTWYMRV